MFVRTSAFVALSALGLTSAGWDTKVRPVEVARVPTYTEGVVVDHDGNLYVSHADQISRITPDGRVTAWARMPSPNGHKILADGTHLVCDRTGGVYHLSASGEVLRQIGARLGGGNDICLDPASGGFYYTSPYGAGEQPIGNLYYVDSAGQVHPATGKLWYPNGLVLRPGGKTLVVGESLKNRVIEFPVLAPGKLGPFRVLAGLPKQGQSDPAAKPDGMALDLAGNLYVAHYGTGRIRVLDPKGALIASLPGVGTFTSNVAFAGSAMDHLYITGSAGPTEQSTGLLMRLDLPWVKGLRVLPARR